MRVHLLLLMLLLLVIDLPVICCRINVLNLPGTEETREIETSEDGPSTPPPDMSREGQPFQMQPVHSCCKNHTFSFQERRRKVEKESSMTHPQQSQSDLALPLKDFATKLES